jgi:hypothetical protein
VEDVFCVACWCAAMACRSKGNGDGKLVSASLRLPQSTSTEHPPVLPHIINSTDNVESEKKRATRLFFSYPTTSPSLADPCFHTLNFIFCNTFSKLHGRLQQAAEPTSVAREDINITRLFGDNRHPSPSPKPATPVFVNANYPREHRLSE